MSGHDVEIYEKLKRENRELKRQLKALRREIDRIDYEHLNNLVEAQEGSLQDIEQKVEYTSKRERNEENWKCFDCKDGVLRLRIFQKPGGAVYFRVCDKCGKRTKTQKYTNLVDGVK